MLYWFCDSNLESFFFSCYAVFFLVQQTVILSLASVCYVCVVPLIYGILYHCSEFPRPSYARNSYNIYVVSTKKTVIRKKGNEHIIFLIKQKVMIVNGSFICRLYYSPNRKNRVTKLSKCLKFHTHMVREKLNF